jgi:hypothetical protein
MSCLQFSYNRCTCIALSWNLGSLIGSTIFGLRNEEDQDPLKVQSEISTNVRKSQKSRNNKCGKRIKKKTMKKYLL